MRNQVLVLASSICLLGLLGRAARYRTVNEFLERLDEDGVTLARFEAMPASHDNPVPEKR